MSSFIERADTKHRKRGKAFLGILAAALSSQVCLRTTEPRFRSTVRVDGGRDSGVSVRLFRARDLVLRDEYDGDT